MNNNTLASQFILKKEIFIDKTVKNVNVTNEMGKDVTNYFNIVNDGNYVTATLKEEFLSSYLFYAHLYNLNVTLVYDNEYGLKHDTASEGRSYSIIEETKQPSTKFVDLKYDINTSASVTNGTVSKNFNKNTVNIGDNNSYTVTFSANDNYIISKVVINGEEKDLSSLSKNSNGKYYYTFVNENIHQTINQTIDITAISNITNISGTKTWLDDNNSLGLRPDSYNLKLYADNVFVKSLNFSADSWCFDNLVKYNADMSLINYTIQENPINLSNGDKYVPTIDGFDVINTLTGNTKIKAKKVWLDNNNSDNTRPDKITIRIFAHEN